MPTLEELNAVGVGYLPGLVGVRILEVAPKRVKGELLLRQELMAPNGYLHAASVIALADPACGYGVLATLPDGANGFTTIELKSNFIGTAREGVIACEATMVHGGRTTQVWDSTVTDNSGRTIALFRCTQMV